MQTHVVTLAESRILAGEGIAREVRRRLAARQLAPTAIPPADFLRIVEEVGRAFATGRTYEDSRIIQTLVKRQIWAGQVPTIPTADELAAA